MGNPAEETYCYPNIYNFIADSSFVNWLSDFFHFSVGIRMSPKVVQILVGRPATQIFLTYFLHNRKNVL